MLANTKNRDKLILALFLAAIVVIIVLTSIITSRKSQKSVRHGDSGEKIAASAGAKIRGKSAGAISLTALFDQKLSAVKPSKLRGMEFRAKTAADEDADFHEKIIQSDSKTFFLRSALRDGTLVAVLSEQDGGDFEIFCDFFSRKLSEDAAVWKGRAKRKGKLLYEPVFVCKNVDFPKKSDVVYAYSADVKAKRIKDFKISSIEFER